MENKVLQSQQICATLQPNIAVTPQTDKQLIKFMRRVMALSAGRHEIIVTVSDGVQDWTVRSIGKVEN